MVEAIIAQNIPLGIECAGFFRDALFAKPDNIPVTHGYINAKHAKKSGVTPVYGSGS